VKSIGASRQLPTLIGAIAIVFVGCAGPVTTSAISSPTAAPPAATPASPTPSLSTPSATPSSAPASGTWTVTGNMITARAEHTATLLPNGKVLVAGGIPDNTEQVQLASAELYDPGTGKWTATGAMLTPRSKHTATLLANGKVLVAGGFCDSRTTKGCPADEDLNGGVANAEVYDPATGRWSATGEMSTERYGHTATLLANGNVLVAGADLRAGILALADLYDPATGRWTPTASMSTARTQQFAVKLADGKVLVAGGFGPVSPTEHGPLVSTEVFDPGTRRWAATGDLPAAHVQIGTMALLRDGKVLLAGGGGSGDPRLASAELYDPGSVIWTSTANMHGPRGESASTLLADGRVFVVGGFSVSDDPNAPLLSSAEIFDPISGSWIDAGSAAVASFDLTATLLTNGQVLVTGGLVPDGVTSSAELYDPGPGN
jgi:N-acetylneuraminic acid mutarotase